MRIRRIVSSLGAVAIVFSVAISGAGSIHTLAVPSDASYMQRIEELDKQAKEIDEKLEKAQKDADSAQAQKDAIDEKIAVVQEKISAINEYSRTLADDIAKADAKMREAKAKTDEKKAEIEEGVAEFKERLRAMYVSGTSSYTDVLFSSESFYDLLMRAELINRVSKHDSDAIDDLIKLKDEYEKNQNELEKELSQLQSKSKDYKEQLKKLNEQNSELLKLAEESSMTLDELNNLKTELMQKGYDIDAQKEALKTTTTTTTSITSQTATNAPLLNGNNTGSTNSATQSQGTQKPSESSSDAPSQPPQNNNQSQSAGGIAAVIATAQSMVGGSYVWGASSQYEADCSGLTMYCYGKIGVSLPHNAAAQSGYGHAVSRDSMQPGDLIFFGSPAYHVALYVGDGMMIHAENSYTGIVYSYVDTFALYNPISAIRRIL